MKFLWWLSGLAIGFVIGCSVASRFVTDYQESLRMCVAALKQSNDDAEMYFLKWGRLLTSEEDK